MIGTYFVLLGIGILILLAAGGLLAGAAGGVAWTAARVGYRLGQLALAAIVFVVLLRVLS